MRAPPVLQEAPSRRTVSPSLIYKLRFLMCVHFTWLFMYDCFKMKQLTRCIFIQVGHGHKASGGGVQPRNHSHLHGHGVHLNHLICMSLDITAGHHSDNEEHGKSGTRHAEEHEACICAGAHHVLKDGGRLQEGSGGRAAESHQGAAAAVFG